MDVGHIVNMYKMKKILFFIAVILCLVSCRNNKGVGNIICCQAESAITEFPDSSFFSDITCMLHHQDKVYVLDKKRGDIVALNEDFSTMGYVSHHGEAPYETVWPFTFNILKDTVYAVDFGTKSMKMFYEGNFCGSFSLSNANENRFCLNDSLIFLSATTDSTSFLIIDRRNLKKQIPKGRVVRENTPFKTIISNKKHILYEGGKGIFAISDCYPYIDQYTIYGEYVKTFDISYVSVIKKAIEEADKFALEEKSIYTYIRDAYLANDCIYLLCSSRDSQNNYKVNTILAFSINNEMKLISSYILPHDIYSSFCVSNTYLFAAQKGRGTTIEKFKIDNAEK